MTATETETTALAPTEYNPLAMIDRAIASGMDPDRLGKLFDLAERWEKRVAAEAFANAIADFQANCPPVHKSRQADRYAFANFDDVMTVAEPHLRRNRIALSFTTDEGDGESKKIIITIRVRVGSYFEDYHFASPIAAGVKLTAPQEFGMTLKYLQRYALCAALNIRTTDIQDNDAQGSVSAEDIEALNSLFDAAKAKRPSTDWKKFLKWLDVAEVRDMTPAQLAKGKAWLEAIVNGEVK